MTLREAKITYTKEGYIKGIIVLMQDKGHYKAYGSNTTETSGYYRLPKSKRLTQGMIDMTCKNGFKLSPEHFFPKHLKYNL